MDHVEPSAKLLWDHIRMATNTEKISYFLRVIRIRVPSITVFYFCISFRHCYARYINKKGNIYHQKVLKLNWKSWQSYYIEHTCILPTLKSTQFNYFFFSLILYSKNDWNVTYMSIFVVIEIWISFNGRAWAMSQYLQCKIFYFHLEEKWYCLFET